MFVNMSLSSVSRSLIRYMTIRLSSLTVSDVVRSLASKLRTGVLIRSCSKDTVCSLFDSTPCSYLTTLRRSSVLASIASILFIRAS